FAQRACSFRPLSPQLLNTLGIAQYRMKQYENCVASLKASDQILHDRGKNSDFTNLLFIAMAQHQLGQTAESADMFARAKDCYDDKSVESISFMHEARRLLVPASDLPPVAPPTKAP
ncbi:MAG: hypothetical protein H7210_02150, partial [Pyrinomonadaceae bacterium]|nr:hypothetical protein [Phycisphaerales bacterium]